MKRALASGVTICLLLSGCGGHRAPVAERSLNAPRPLASTPVSAQRPAPRGYYRVRSGDTLYSIAWRYGKDYRALARANGIGSDYRIYTCQLLRLRNEVRQPRQSQACCNKYVIIGSKLSVNV